MRLQAFLLRSGMALLLFLLAGAPAPAAVLIHLTFDEMVAQSSAIFRGRCVEVRSAWSPEWADIVTHHVFEVREYYKGNLGARVTITELGGQIGNIVAEYPGIPDFQVGEEAVVLLWTDPRGIHQVIGLTQGKFGVSRNSQTGAVLLRQTRSNEPMLEPSEHAHAGPVEPLAFPLATFRSRVSAVLQRRPGGNGR